MPLDKSSTTLHASDKEAIIYLKDSEIDKETLQQVTRMLDSTAVDHARVMPDCHPGVGCCVGFTSKLTTHAMPSYIGGDIGCGMSVYPIEIPIEKILKKPDVFCNKIEQVVPVGVDIHSSPVSSIDELYPEAQHIAEEFSAAYQKEFGIDVSSYIPTYNNSWFELLLKRTGAKRQNVLCQIGTLGGGNHFLEVGKDEEEKVYVTVHSGSRGLGQHICKYHQNIITKGSKPDWDGYEKELKRINKKDRAARDPELRLKYLSASHASYLNGVEAYMYYFDMIFAQCYAALNRRVMLSRAVDALGYDMDVSRMIQSTHNYIDFGHMIWRKGAISAIEGELIVIALNMRDGVLLAHGKGNPEWNYSAPHGAGRLVPRGAASQCSTVKEFKESMKNVYANHIGEDTLDESPVMYKSSDLIKERSGETCEIYKQIIPLINIKGVGK